MKKNHNLLSLLNTKNIIKINIREYIKEAHLDVTPKILETIILTEATNIRPVTATREAPITEDHTNKISNISRATVTPTTVDQED